MTLFKGSIPALITPFKNGEIDWKAFENFIEWQIEQGSHAVVPCGTTGESPTLSADEHKSIVERTIAVVKKRIPVIAGTGSNDTKKAIEMTKHAKEAGADGALIVTPYYNKPTQDGLYAHFKAINDAVSLPIILYNIPGRSVIDMKNETIARLAALPHIKGLKDATNDVSRVNALREMVGAEFCQLSGEDGTAAGFLAQGGHGCISVAANVAPALCAKMHEAWWKRDLETFAKARDALAPLGRDLFCETSPAPIKYAVSTLGFCSDEMRLPMLPASKTAREKVDAAMAHAGLAKSGKETRAARA